jgi:hypothetical protein
MYGSRTFAALMADEAGHAVRDDNLEVVGWRVDMEVICKLSPRI